MEISYKDLKPGMFVVSSITRPTKEEGKEPTTRTFKELILIVKADTTDTDKFWNAPHIHFLSANDSYYGTASRLIFIPNETFELVDRESERVQKACTKIQEELNSAIRHANEGLETILWALNKD